MIAALFSVLFLASDTSGASTQDQAAPTAATEAAKEERKICKREAATESRLASKRICLTAAQWKARADADVEYRRR